MSEVSPEMGRKKLSGDRDLKIIFALGGKNSSRTYDEYNIGFLHSYQICMEAFKMESLPDTNPSDFQQAKKHFFNQPLY